MFSKKEWFIDFKTLKSDVVSAILVGFAIIPEAIAFSMIAGVEPKVGIYGSICLLILTSFFGGRPAMISAATAAMALLMVDLVKSHGVEYLFMATILTGILQIIFGVLKVSNLMKFVPKSVIIGFIDALAILIFTAQIPEIMRQNEMGLILIGVSLIIIYGFPLIPKIGKILPSGLIALVLITIGVYYFKLDVRMIKDLSELPKTLPLFALPNAPFSFDTLYVIFPYSLSLAVVGILDSLMTSELVEQNVGTPSNRVRECFGQGIGNIAAGFFGGMAGCGMIGQSMINVKGGAKTRLSTLIAGIWLLLAVAILPDFVNIIPMAALVGIMIMVSFGTFNYQSIKMLKTHPMDFKVSLIGTIAITIITHNLALGVLIGVCLNIIFFVNKMSKFTLCSCKIDNESSTKIYKLKGQIFFLSAQRLNDFFDFDDNKKVVIDITHTHFWDVSAIVVFDEIINKFKSKNIEVKIIGKGLKNKHMFKNFSKFEK